MPNENSQNEEGLQTPLLPLPQREVSVMADITHLTEIDLETTKEADIRMLMAKLKGFQTLGKLYKDEHDKNQQLVQVNQELNARLEGLKHPHQPPGSDFPGSSTSQPGHQTTTAPDITTNTTTRPLEEWTEHGRAGHSMTSPPSEGQGHSKVNEEEKTGDAPPPLPSDGFHWEMPEENQTAPSVPLKQDTEEYPAMEGPEPDFKNLVTSLETCVKSSPPGVASDLIRLSVQALKKQRNECVKQELMTNMKIRLKERDKLIKQLREQLKAQESPDESLREDWVDVTEETTDQTITILKRQHAQEVAALQQEIDDSNAHTTEQQLKASDLQQEVDDLKRKLSNEQVASRESASALSESQRRSESLQSRNDQLQNSVSQLKRQCLEDEQIIEALTTQNRNLKVSASSPSDEAAEKLKVEIEVLKQQVTIYKEDFDQERKSREKAHAEKEALEANFAKYKIDLKRTQKEVVRSRQVTHGLEEEIRDLQMIKREKCEELRLAQQQVDVLQGKLHKLESERKHWHAAMYTPPAYYLQQNNPAANKTWTCPSCTLINKMENKRCDICSEKAPPFRLTQSSATGISTWTDSPVCDNIEPGLPRPLVSRSGPMGSASRLSGGPPDVQSDTTTSRTSHKPNQT